jgi:hypothetical protein
VKHQVIAVLVGSLFALPALAGEQNAQQVNEWEYPALVATSSFSRAEVLAQLTEARSTGDFVANAETGDKAYQLYPSVYPARAVAAGKTRAEVLAELIDAERDGNLIANAETGTLTKGL